MSFARLSIVRVGGYSLLMITSLTAVNAIDRSVVLGLGPLEGIGFYASEGGLWKDLIFAVVASFLVTGFLQVRKLHNPGEIRRLLSGRYHYPVEETRVFLFADVVGSTGIAESLGHMAYSSFLKGLFFRHFRSDSRLARGGVPAMQATSCS